MNDSENIVHQDVEIDQILAATSGCAAELLFERYRIAGSDWDAFVAALVGRPCVWEARLNIGQIREGAE